jgi:GTP cyclohydrolase II
VSAAVERAIDELKRGRPVRVGDGRERIAVLAIELADANTLAAFDTPAPARLLVTDKRAAVLGLGNQIDAAGMRAVLIERSPWIDLATARAIADPVLDLATPLKGPFRSLPLGGMEGPAASALLLTKHAGLLPALFVAEVGEVDALGIAAAEIDAFADAGRLVEVSRARLPIKAHEKTEVVAFRAPGGPEHLALVIGDPYAGVPLVRLHSACLTGDLLGSLKCDCGDQLQAALAAIAASGGGVLLYLQQEGRGIGLVNKLRAYALQDQGFDTVDANLRLGFEIDERDFALAAAMLKALALTRIRLLTNNPAKVAGLEAHGITVAARLPLTAGEGAHNAAYLATKRDRTGHLL